MDVLAIKAKVKNRQRLTPKEAALYIKSDPEAMAAFMIENNPGNVNYTLREMGYSHLTFEPNPVALARQLQILIDQKKEMDFAQVVKNFRIDINKVPGSLLTELQNNK